MSGLAAQGNKKTANTLVCPAKAAKVWSFGLESALSRKAMTTLLILIIILAAGYLFMRPQFGGAATGERLTRIQGSGQYNNEAGKFQNRVSAPASGRGRSTLQLTYDFFVMDNNRFPRQKLPEAPPPLAALRTKSDDLRFIWFGHSTILLEIDGLRVLIDPVFSNYASPIPFTARRFQPPVLPLAQLTGIDLVLISHDHYDHLDYSTIKQLKKRDVPFIMPLGVGAHLAYWGIAESRIIELDWWQSADVQGVTFTAAPSQHFSGRTTTGNNPTLWASWAIKSKNRNVYFSGDSGYSGHYRQIGRRLGPFDLAFLENGAYSDSWKYVHQLPEEGVQASLDLGSNAMVPVHWAMFSLGFHSWYEPIQRATREAKAKGVNIITPMLGQLVELNGEVPPQAWWEPLVEAEQQLQD